MASGVDHKGANSGSTAQNQLVITSNQPGSAIHGLASADFKAAEDNSIFTRGISGGVSGKQLQS